MYYPCSINKGTDQLCSKISCAVTASLFSHMQIAGLLAWQLNGKTALH